MERFYLSLGQQWPTRRFDENWKDTELPFQLVRRRLEKIPVTCFLFLSFWYWPDRCWPLKRKKTIGFSVIELNQENQMFLTCVDFVLPHTPLPYQPLRCFNLDRKEEGWWTKERGISWLQTHIVQTRKISSRIEPRKSTCSWMRLVCSHFHTHTHTFQLLLKCTPFSQHGPRNNKKKAPSATDNCIP